MDELETLRILNETINRKIGLPRTIIGSSGLAAGDLIILYALLTEDRPLTQSEIARFLFRSRQTINSSLQKMQQQGLLKLVPDNGRKKRILLTQKGRNITEKYVRPGFEMELRALSCFSQEERAGFASLLIKFGDALERESDFLQSAHKIENNAAAKNTRAIHPDRNKEELSDGTDSVCE
ncbi:MAG: MarR family winged helix-turn-helix transcriptional regulator [Bilifractor sp.]